MSRAFVREDRPDTEPLPDLPVSPHPNLVTARGLADLRRRMAEAEAELARLRARPDRLDRMPERAIERDIRYLARRLASAILVPPPPEDRVGFGHRVTVEDEAGGLRRFEIVGEDEADAAHGTVSHVSPMALALFGKGVGDTVTVAGKEWEVVALGA